MTVVEREARLTAYSALLLSRESRSGSRGENALRMLVGAPADFVRVCGLDLRGLRTRSRLLPTAGAEDAKTAQKSYLDTTGSWLEAAYVPSSPEEKERLLFSNGSQ